MKEEVGIANQYNRSLAVIWKPFLSGLINLHRQGGIFFFLYLGSVFMDYKSGLSRKK